MIHIEVTVAQGWDYKKQVFDSNSSETNNSSCVSSSVKGTSIGNGRPGGSGGNPGNSGGTVIPGNGGAGSAEVGTVWCLVQRGIVQYCWRQQHASN